ncbi:MAG TPA: hypothetical protein VIJ20_00315 [Solirubrobacteraceae bacterium]
MAGSAQATTITASTISSPAANSYIYYDATAPTSTAFTVTGTTTGTDNVDINCYYGTTYVTLENDVSVTSNAFSEPISTSDLSALTNGAGACELRAVETGDGTDYPPGTSSAFAGPSIAVSEKDAYTSAGVVYDFDYYLSGFAGFMDFESPGDCGLDYGNLVADGTLAPSNNSFDCLGSIYSNELTVDGVQAADADSATTDLPGYEGIGLSETFAAGALTIHDDEPILDCVPNCAGATSYTSSGVELDRTWQTADDGRVALQTDVFRSTDGAQHSLTVLEDDGVGNNPNSSFLFPGTSAFQDYAANATVALASGPGTILYKTDGATPDAGDATNPQGAITYASAPNGGPVDFTSSDETAPYNEFVLPYTRTIPAGGSVALRFGYVQDYVLSDVQTLAQAASSTFAPSVSIASPANGATLSSSPITVAGTVTDAAGASSVKVNGVTATLGAGGSFFAPVALTPGADTITAIATDADGITGQQQISVTYKNPPVVTTGKASKVTSTGAKIAGTVNPEGEATAYEVQYGTTTAYKSHTTAANAGVGSAAITTTSTLKGLKASTTYHYRLVATNASGTTDGTARTFKTGKPAPRGLGAKVSPRTATSFPYHYTVKGKLSAPKGVSAKQACTGTITLKVKRGKKTISTTHTKIGKKCTWKASVTLTKKGKVPGSGKLQITPSFGGNKTLAGLTAKPLTVHYR